MKFLIIILFCTFALQNDTTKIDTANINGAIVIQKNINKMNKKLDSIILILGKDTTRVKK